MVERANVVAAHRQLREASDAVQHLLVVEDLTQQQIDDARDRLARAYQQVKDVDEAVLRVSSHPSGSPRSSVASRNSLVECGFDLAETHARSSHDPIMVRVDEHVGPPVEDTRVSGTGLLERESFAVSLPTRPCFAGLLRVSHGSSPEALRTCLKEGPGMSPVSSRSALEAMPRHDVASATHSRYQGAG
jgi:hypothetical protein